MAQDTINTKESIDNILNEHSYNPVKLIDSINQRLTTLNLTNLHNLDFSYHSEYAVMDMIGINYRSDATKYV